ncbi:family 20 glycosylhydrolase, partial [Prolixibacteraceae bacterium]|nr:family 20 glycosylhydrolase [Prolixibacteraceae bacterium]
PQALYQISHTEKITIPDTISISSNSALFMVSIKAGTNLLHENTGKVCEKVKQGGLIQIVRETKNSLGKEGYKLSVSKEGIIIKATDNSGVLYAFQTLSQLISKSNDNLTIETCYIKDKPQYSFRGLEMDLCSHMYSIDELKKLIDVMSHFKMNRLILTLSNKFGWRIEIKKRPKLAEICSIRKNIGFKYNQTHHMNKNDGQPYGGVYTQADMYDLVHYAHKKNIQIIPKFYVSREVCRLKHAYPELTCKQTHNFICKTATESLDFWNDVFSEMTTIFKNPYIAIDDSRRKFFFKDLCERCKEASNKDPHSYNDVSWKFMRDLEKIANKNQREIIGGNKLYKYSKNPKSIAQLRRGIEEADKIWRKGNKIIYSPISYVLSMNESHDTLSVARSGILSLEDVYNFNPFGNNKNNGAILGISAILPTRNSPSFKYASIHLFPRLLAIAERGWAGYQKTNWETFNQRVQAAKSYLKNQDMIIGYPSQDIRLKTKKSSKGELLLTMHNEANTPIWYTTNGKEPTLQSNLHTKPIKIKDSLRITYITKDKRGIPTPIKTTKIVNHKAIHSKITYKYNYSMDRPNCSQTTLIDGIRNNYQFIELEDFDFIIDLGKNIKINEIKTSWASYPQEGVVIPTIVKYEVSKDGKRFRNIYQEHFELNSKKNRTKTVTCLPLKTTARYIHVLGRNRRRITYKTKHNLEYTWLKLDEVIVK